jgi:hypothetical protein
MPLTFKAYKRYRIEMVDLGDATASGGMVQNNAEYRMPSPASHQGPPATTSAPVINDLPQRVIKILEDEERLKKGIFRR